MTVGTLFFSWNGRCARRPYWAGIVAIEIAIIVCAMLLGLMGLGAGGTALTTLIFAYPRICILTKRFHDLGRSGWWQLLPNIVSTLLARGGSALIATEAQALGGLLVLLGLIVEFGFLIWLGSVRSEPRSNDFGPPPGQSQVAEVFS